MTQPYIGEIQVFGFNFNPRGWAFCNGATLPISQNTALFALLGTTYGGNGQTTFQLPNFAFRAPMEQGAGPGLSPRTLGETGGVQNVTLTPNQMPAHTHGFSASSTAGTVASPLAAVPAPGASGRTPPPRYATAANTLMGPSGTAGGGQPHQNLQPYLGINFCIALQGIFPSFP